MQAILRTGTLIVAALLSNFIGGMTVATAADRVTLVLRSGEKITGDLDGQTENRIYIRTSFTTQPQVPIEQIVMIDVSGDAINLPAEEVSQAAGPAHYLVPRSGAPMKGQFIRLEGSLGGGDPKPPVVVFRKESGEETRIAVSDMRRLYLGNFSTAGIGTQTSTSTPSNAPLSAGERTVAVMANSDWVDTGLMVRQGQVVTFSASGEITMSADQNDKAIPTGSTTGRMVPNAQIPTASAGTLIARVAGPRGRGASAPMAIGNQMSVPMPAAGRLFLRVNDDNLADNTGQYEVRIKVNGTD
jgi:hypothetical protein